MGSLVLMRFLLEPLGGKTDKYFRTNMDSHDSMSCLYDLII